MPQDIGAVIWVVGGGFIAILLGVIAWFMVRLVNGMDAFKDDILSSVGKLSDSLHGMHVDHESRLAVIETAGCGKHREARND